MYLKNIVRKWGALELARERERERERESESEREREICRGKKRKKVTIKIHGREP